MRVISQRREKEREREERGGEREREIDLRTRVVGRALRAWPEHLLLLRQAVSLVVKAWLYVCKCRVYVMRVGTLMPGDRGCRSHASRWGPYSWTPSTLIRPFFLLSRSFHLPPFRSLLFPPPSHLRFHVSVSHFSSIALSLFLFAPPPPPSLPSSLADLGHYIYGRWRYSLPNATQTSLRDAW